MNPMRTCVSLQIAVRLPFALVDRLDELAQKLSSPGLELGRADVVRMALERGCAEMERGDDGGKKVKRK